MIASHAEWIGRSVESVLDLHGYDVVRVEEGRGALEAARRVRPDALILDSSLQDLGGIEICRALVNDPLFDRSAPIFITPPAPVSNRVRRDAYEAGAWDLCSHPLDVETVLLKLGTFLRARRRLQDERGDLLIDPVTGLYNSYGLRHWTERLGARAARKHEPFACLALSTNSSHVGSFAGGPVSSAVRALADICRTESRQSDIVGYVGESRFAILAPETDGAGARQFASRLQRAVDGAGRIHGLGPTMERGLRVGFFAVSDFSAVRLEASEVVRRAETALAYAGRRSSPDGAVSFDEVPNS
jgi:PleD family two-component response regulator